MPYSRVCCTGLVPRAAGMLAAAFLAGTVLFATTFWIGLQHWLTGAALFFAPGSRRRR